MGKRFQNGTKVMYEEAIRQNIANKNWQMLFEAMNGAERITARHDLESKV
jgi:hypothetical protein